MPPGTMFVLPAQVPFDIWNVPDAEAARISPRSSRLGRGPDLPPPPPRGSDLQVRLTPVLVAAAVHAASALGDGAAQACSPRGAGANCLALLSIADKLPRRSSTHAGGAGGGSFCAATSLIPDGVRVAARLAPVGIDPAPPSRPPGHRLQRPCSGPSACGRPGPDREASATAPQAAALAVGYASRAHFAAYLPPPSAGSAPRKPPLRVGDSPATGGTAASPLRFGPDPLPVRTRSCSP